MLILGVCWMKQHRKDTMKELGANICEYSDAIGACEKISVN